MTPPEVHARRWKTLGVLSLSLISGLLLTGLG
jgi:hypothetical protein